VNYKVGGKHWVLDSGCSQHMTGNSSMFTTLGHPREHEHVTYGDNSRVRIVGLGRIAITKDLSISNVLFVESLSFNLLSVAQLCDLRLICTFDKNGVVVINEKDKSLVFKGFRHGHIYLVDFSSKEENSMTCLFSKSSLEWLWHRRIAYIGMSNLEKAHKRGMITDLKDVTFDKNKLCSACQVGKQVATHHPLKMMLSTSKPFELLHMDLFGPTTYKSIGGKLYCLVIVDDYSCYTWTMFLGDKSETLGIFKTFVRRAPRDYNTQIVKIRSGNGTEIKSMNIEEWCNEEGMKHEFSITYTPQQNVVVERKNKTLITLARAILDDYGTPKKFWVKAINTACRASNRVYIHRLLEKMPYKLLIGKKPNISYFHVFGCKCFIYKKKRLGKFESRCDDGFFLSYASNSKAYRVFNKTSGLVEETCDVEFDESNGSQGEIVSYENVGDDEVIEALKNMPIGDIKLEEVRKNSDKERQDTSSSTPSTSMVPQVDEDEENDDTLSQLDIQSPTTQAQDQH
jgi:transposase InsO family protein